MSVGIPKTKRVGFKCWLCPSLYPSIDHVHDMGNDDAAYHKLRDIAVDPTQRAAEPRRVETVLNLQPVLGKRPFDTMVTKRGP